MWVGEWGVGLGDGMYDDGEGVFFHWPCARKSNYFMDIYVRGSMAAIRRFENLWHPCKSNATSFGKWDFPEMVRLDRTLLRYKHRSVKLPQHNPLGVFLQSAKERINH